MKALCNTQSPPLTLRGNTIDPLNQTLKSANVYDQTQHRRIQVLGDIRNRCSHSVSEPASKEEIWELWKALKTSCLAIRLHDVARGIDWGLFFAEF